MTQRPDIQPILEAARAATKEESVDLGNLTHGDHLWIRVHVSAVSKGSCDGKVARSVITDTKDGKLGTALWVDDRNIVAAHIATSNPQTVEALCLYIEWLEGEAREVLGPVMKGYHRSDVEDDWQECAVCYGWINHYGHAKDCRAAALAEKLESAK